MQSRFDRNVANKNVYVVSSQAGAVREDNNVIDVIRGGGNKAVGITTGVVINNGEVDYLQMIRKQALYLIPVSDVQLADADVSNYVSLANSYLEDILINQKEIAYQISICALLLKYLEPSRDVSEYRSKLIAYYNRFEERNEVVKLYSQDVASAHIAQLDNALKSANIGIAVSAGLVILISCVVTASFASLAWYAYYKEADASRKDARDIIKLNKLLAELDEDVRAEVFDIINKYGDENYQAGVRKIKMQNIFGGVKNILLFGGLGVIAYYLFLNKERYDTDR